MFISVGPLIADNINIRAGFGSMSSPAEGLVQLQDSCQTPHLFVERHSSCLHFSPLIRTFILFSLITV